MKVHDPLVLLKYSISYAASYPLKMQYSRKYNVPSNVVMVVPEEMKEGREGREGRGRRDRQCGLHVIMLLLHDWESETLSLGQCYCKPVFKYTVCSVTEPPLHVHCLWCSRM